MSGQGLVASVPDLLNRWIADDPATQVIDAAWQWQPKWPASLLLTMLVLLWLAVILTHRSRRIALGTGWRVGLGLLRAAVVTVPVLMLMQPHIAARLERSEPKTLAVLLDRSDSMSIKDGPEAEPFAETWT